MLQRLFVKIHRRFLARQLELARRDAAYREACAAVAQRAQWQRPKLATINVTASASCSALAISERRAVKREVVP